MLIALTDHQQPDVDLERTLVEEAGHEFVAFQCRDEDEVIGHCRGASGVFAQYAPMTARVIRALPELSIISINAVGTDSIDLEAARQCGVWVCNVPGASTNEVATHALGLALSGIRRLKAFDRSVREGRWSLDIARGMQRPAKMTLGIVGFGSIGQELARIAAPCFGSVIAHDPFQPEHRFRNATRAASLDSVFEESHVISLHLPLTPETTAIVGSGLLSRVRTGCYLVNVSRGGIIDHEALLEAIESGKVSGAGLDVLPEEPPEPNDPILDNPAIQLTPHAAYFSMDAEADLRRQAINNILAWHETGSPPNAVVVGSGNRV
ncbi:MAG: C-terminal binding protein [Gemmatimonadota bacterium]|nr:C-terminal binding protein [Gemmatimonadota bacterium]